MFNIDLGKYRNIIVSIALFLLLDASVLILNFYISFEIADDAVSVNLSGRQRMLSQRMTKSLLDLDYSFYEQDGREKALDELKFSRNLFDETLTAFQLGGVATGAMSDQIHLNRVTDRKSLQAIKDGQGIWNDYREKIDRVLEFSGVVDSDKLLEQQGYLNEAILFGRSNNLDLLKSMNDLTVSLEQVAASKANRLRLIQTVGILMALINFFIIMFHFVRQLKAGDEVVEAARKETTEILDTVNEGLFLIHKDYRIGSQRSEKLGEILSLNKDQDANFEDLLKNLVSGKDADASHGFLRLLFNPKVKEKLIGSLNPLDRVQVNIDDGSGMYETKYLSFDFKRVLKGGEIVDILTTVNDVTENVKLEKALQQANEANKKQIEMLTSILHANPSLLKSFIENSYQCFSRINQLLKKQAKTHDEFFDKINKMLVEMHNFKGEASALELSEFAAMAHEFENILVKMKETDVKGQDFLPLTIQLDKMISYAQSVTRLVDKLSEFSQSSDAKSHSPLLQTHKVDQWAHLNNLVNDLSQAYQKQVMLVSSGLGEVIIPHSLRETINSLCIQFLRNAVVHGIETPDDRLVCQKPSEGRIDIRLSSTPKGDLELVVRDDGAGFDYHKIREKALSLGKWSESEIESWNNKQLLSLIFSQGFSTAEVVDEHAGRGVGMDIISQKIKQHRGKITLHSRQGQFSRFVVTFPAYAQQQVA